MKSFEFREVGKIHSCYPDKFGTPRQPGLVPSSRAVLKIHKEWQPESSLQGLEKFSHLWILFIFHLNTNKGFHAKVHPPRLGGASMGVFATRSPHRVNPLGQSLVKIEKIDGDEITISGVDLVDGTPVIDIKPYLPEVESIVSAQNGWLQNVPQNQIQILWSEEALKNLRSWASLNKKYSEMELKNIVEETISQDPRPIVYRGFEGQESPYRQNHAVRIYDGDIHFKFIEDTVAEILIIKLA